MCVLKTITPNFWGNYDNDSNFFPKTTRDIYSKLVYSLLEYLLPSPFGEGFGGEAFLYYLIVSVSLFLKAS